MQRIIKGDKVRVIAGKWKGSEGIVLKVFPKLNAAVVENINKVKRHQKSGKNENKDGGIIEKEVPLKLSKLTLLDAKSKAVYNKVTYTLDKHNKKQRVNRKTQALIVKPK